MKEESFRVEKTSVTQSQADSFQMFHQNHNP